MFVACLWRMVKSVTAVLQLNSVQNKYISHYNLIVTNGCFTAEHTGLAVWSFPDRFALGTLNYSEIWTLHLASLQALNDPVCLGL